MADTPAGSAPATPSASPAPASATPTPAASTPSSQPTPAAAPVTSSLGGEPPKERWPDILSNARQKARAEAEAEFRQRYGKYDQFETDPYGAVMGWLEQAASHSQYAPQITNWAANHLRSRRGSQAPVEPPKPNVPIVDAHGNITGYTYDADGLAKREEWFQQQLAQKWQEQFGPIQEREQARAEREAHEAMQRESWHYAAQTLQNLRQQPYFTEHQQRIAQVLEEHPEWGDNVYAAYNHVLVTEILPSLGTTAAQQAITDLTNKAGANTVVPGSPITPGPQFKKNDFASALKYFAEHPDEAARVARR